MEVKKGEELHHVERMGETFEIEDGLGWYINMLSLSTTCWCYQKREWA